MEYKITINKSEKEIIGYDVINTRNDKEKGILGENVPEAMNNLRRLMLRKSIDGYDWNVLLEMKCEFPKIVINTHGLLEKKAIENIKGISGNIQIN